MSLKSTHYGRCQCCDSRQKLPGGVLSTHGYTVQWGFFSGVCQGTGHPPFEKSKDLIETFILSAKKRLEEVKAEQDKLRQPATKDKAWLNEYIPARRRGERSRYVYRYVDVIRRTQTHGDHSWFNFFYVDFEGKDHRIERYDVSSDETLAVCSSLNAKKADALDKTVAEIKRYIQWQQHRIVEWKPQALKPIPPEAEAPELGSTVSVEWNGKTVSGEVVYVGGKCPVVRVISEKTGQLFLLKRLSNGKGRHLPWRDQQLLRNQHPEWKTQVKA